MSRASGAANSSGALAIRNSTQKALAFSKSLGETAPRVLSLQRDVLRSVPWIKRAYNVQLPENVMRSLITEKFREKKGATDVHTVNRLVVQGRMELEETLMLWKGGSHVCNFFEDAAELKKEKAKPPPGFLENFFDGR